MIKKKSDFARGRKRGIRETLNFIIRYEDMPTTAKDMEQYLLPHNTAKSKLGRPKYGYRRLSPFGPEIDSTSSYVNPDGTPFYTPDIRK